MPTENAIRRAVARLSLMKFFSGDPDSRAAISEALNEICASDEQVDQLSRHFPKVFPEWTGVYELRACACTMFPPADGIDVASSVYPEGIPTPRELQVPALAAIPPAARRLDLAPGEQVEAYKQLEAGGPVTADPELEALVKQIAHPIPPAGKKRTLAEIEYELYGDKGPPKPDPATVRKGLDV